MFDLILIRHGEAVGQGSYLGCRSNPPLAENGRNQVGSLSAKLKADGLEPGKCMLFSSPQKRALETAGILSSAEPAVIEEFAEIDFGDWDGLAWEEVSAAEPEAYRAWLGNPADNAPPGGETLTEFKLRAEAGLAKLFEADCIKAVSGGPDAVPVIITAHGGTIRALLYSLLELDMARPWLLSVDCASYSSIRVYRDGGRRTAVLHSLNVK